MGSLTQGPGGEPRGTGLGAPLPCLLTVTFLAEPSCLESSVPGGSTPRAACMVLPQGWASWNGPSPERPKHPLEALSGPGIPTKPGVLALPLGEPSMNQLPGNCSPSDSGSWGLSERHLPPLPTLPAPFLTLPYTFTRCSYSPEGKGLITSVPQLRGYHHSLVVTYYKIINSVVSCD